jgi:hypothetical protein
MSRMPLLPRWIVVLGMAAALVCAMQRPAPGVAQGRRAHDGQATVSDLPPDEMIDFEVVSSLGGTIGAVVVRDEVAYLGIGTSLVVLAATAWNEIPERLGGYEWSTGRIRRLVLDGDYLYAALSESELCILDVSDPAQPVDLRRLDFIGIQDLDVADGFLYVLDEDGLSVFAIGDLSSGAEDAIQRVALVDTPGDGFALDVLLDRCYVADGSTGLTVYDVSDPASPSVLATLATDDSTQAVVVVDAIAYLAAGSGLLAVDVSDPTQPSVTGHYADADDEVVTLAVYAGRAYLGLANGELTALDVADPAAPGFLWSQYDYVPSEPGLCQSPSYAPIVAPGGANSLYIAWPEHMMGYDLETETMGAEYARELTCAKTIVADKDYAYVGGRSFGESALAVVDIAVPWQPSIVGTLAVTGTDAMALDGDRLVLARAHGLDVLDVSDPVLPRLVGSCALPFSSPFAVAIAGDQAYVTGSGDTVSIVDIEDPPAPRPVGLFSAPDAILWGVAVEGDRAYVTESHGLLVIDVSDPTAPVLLASLDLPGETRDVGLYGGHAFVVDAFGTGELPGRMHVVDVSEPADPRLVTTLVVPTNGHLTMTGNVAVVAGWGVDAFDVSDPSAPREVGGRGGPPSTADAVATSGHLYSAIGSGGLFSLAMWAYSPGAFDVLFDVATHFAEPPIGCPVEYGREDGVYRYSCNVAAGHSISVALQPFADPTTAAAAWSERRGDLPTERFHGHSAFTTQFDEHPGQDLPMHHRLHVWQAGRWLVTVESFDDTGIEVAPPPLEISELVFESGVRSGIFEESPEPGPPYTVFLPIARFD